MTTINGYRARCGRCENLRNGCCDPAGEALVALGYPLVTVRPHEDSDASKCPDFTWDMDAVIEEEADSIVDDAVRALERAKGFAPHPKPKEAVW